MYSGSQNNNNKMKEPAAHQFTRPKTAGMLPPRQLDNRAVGFSSSGATTLLSGANSQQIDEKLYASNNHSGKKPPAQFKTKTDNFTKQIAQRNNGQFTTPLTDGSYVVLRPKSAMKPKTYDDAVTNPMTSLPKLPAAVQQNSNSNSNNIQRIQICGTSALTRNNDTRSQSIDTIQNQAISSNNWNTAKSSNGEGISKSRKTTKKGVKKKKDQGGGKLSSLSKQMKRTMKQANRYIDNYVTIARSSSAGGQLQLGGNNGRPTKRPQSAAQNHPAIYKATSTETATQQEPAVSSEPTASRLAAEKPPSSGMQPMSSNTERQQHQQHLPLPQVSPADNMQSPNSSSHPMLNGEIERFLKQQQAAQTIQVFNLYGEQNNHNYNSGRNSYASSQRMQGPTPNLDTPTEATNTNQQHQFNDLQNLKPTQSLLQSQSQPVILATNQPPKSSQVMDPQIVPSNDQQFVENQNRKRLLMTSKVPPASINRKTLDNQQHQVPLPLTRIPQDRMQQNNQRRAAAFPQDHDSQQFQTHQHSSLNQRQVDQYMMNELLIGAATVKEREPVDSVGKQFLNQQDYLASQKYKQSEEQTTFDNPNNRSCSVDTDVYMRHLQRKSHSYDKLRGREGSGGQIPEENSIQNNYNIRKNQGGSLRNNSDISLFQNKMYLMDYLENARSINPIRIAKLQSMIEQQGNDPRARQEIRRMLQQLQQDENYAANYSAHSDDEQYAQQNQGYYNRRGDRGQYYPKNSNHFQKMHTWINKNNQYKRLQEGLTNHSSNVQNNYERSKSNSKSASRTRNSHSPVQLTTANNRLGGPKHQQPFNSRHPLAQSHLRTASKINILSQHDGHQRNSRSAKSRHVMMSDKKFIDFGNDEKKLRPKSRHHHKSHNQQRFITKLATTKLRTQSNMMLDSPRQSDYNSLSPNTSPKSSMLKKQKQAKNRIYRNLRKNKFKSSSQLGHTIHKTRSKIKLKMSPSRIEEVFSQSSARDDPTRSLYQASYYEDTSQNVQYIYKEADDDEQILQYRVEEEEEEVDMNAIDGFADNEGEREEESPSTYNNGLLLKEADLSKDNKKSNEIKMLKERLEILEKREIQREQQREISAAETNQLQMQQQLPVPEIIGQQEHFSHPQSSQRKRNNYNSHNNQNPHQRARSIIDDFAQTDQQSISSSKNLDEVDNHPKNGHETSSMITETDYDSKIFSAKKRKSSTLVEVDSTPKSNQPMAALQYQAFSPTNAQIMPENQNKNANVATLAQPQAQITNPATHQVTKQPTLDIVQEISVQEANSPLEVVQELSSTQHQQTRMMFDIGEPSQASDNLAAMLEFDLDIANSSSIVCSSHVKESSKPNIEPIISNKSPNSQKETSDADQGSDKEVHDSERAITNITPSLVKMRTSVEAKTSDLRGRSIEEPLNHNSVGGNVQSELQNSAYKKQQSSIKMTSNKLTPQAISVLQIQAATVTNNDSLAGQPLMSGNSNTNIHKDTIAMTKNNLKIPGLVSHDDSNTRNSNPSIFENAPNTLGPFSDPEIVQDQDNQIVSQHYTEENLDEESSKQDTKQHYTQNSSVSSENFTGQNQPQILQPQQLLSNRKEESPPVNNEKASLINQSEQTQLIDLFSQVMNKFQEQKRQRLGLPQEEQNHTILDQQKGQSMEIATQTSLKKNQQPQNKNKCEQQEQDQQSSLQEDDGDDPSDLPDQSVSQLPSIEEEEDQSLQTIKANAEALIQPVGSINTMSQINGLDLAKVTQLLQGIDKQNKEAQQAQLRQLQVIVRSPFEQEIAEMLALAALQPKARLSYPPTHGTPRIIDYPQQDVAPAQALFIRKQNPSSLSMHDYLGNLTAADLDYNEPNNNLNISMTSNNSIKQARRTAALNSSKQLHLQQQQQSKRPDFELFDRVANSGNYLVKNTFTDQKKYILKNQTEPIDIYVPSQLNTKTREIQIEVQVEQPDRLGQDSQANQIKIQKNLLNLSQQDKTQLSEFDSDHLSTNRVENNNNNTTMGKVSKKSKNSKNSLGDHWFYIDNMAYSIKDVIQKEKFNMLPESVSGSENSSQDQSDLEESSSSSSSSYRAKQEEIQNKKRIQFRNQNWASERRLSVVENITQKSAVVQNIIARSSSSDQLDLYSSCQSPLIQPYYNKNSEASPTTTDLKLDKKLSSGSIETGSPQKEGLTTSLLSSLGKLQAQPSLKLRQISNLTEEQKFGAQLTLQPVIEEETPVAQGSARQNVPQRKQITMHKMQSQIVRGITRQVDKSSQPLARKFNSFLKRQSTAAISSFDKGDSMEKSLAMFETKKNQILSKYVERFMVKENERTGDLELKTKSHKDSLDHDTYPDVGSEASYWDLERDVFNFENITFSIVSNEQIRCQELKFLYQVDWKSILKEKQIQNNIQRMTTQFGDHKSPQVIGLQRIHTSSFVMKIGARNLSKQISMSPSKQDKFIRHSQQSKSDPNVTKEQILTKSKSQYEQSFTGKGLSLEEQVAEGLNMYNWLKQVYPMEKSSKLRDLKTLNLQKECINVGQTLAKLLNVFKEQGPGESLDRSFSRTTFVSNGKSIKPIQKVSLPLKAGQKVNQILSISIHFNDLTKDLKSKLKENSSQNVIYAKNDEIWDEIEIDEYESLVSEIARHPVSRQSGQLKRYSKKKLDLGNLLNLHENQFIMSSNLFVIQNRIVLQEPSPQLPMKRKRFQKSYTEYLQGYIREKCYDTYSVHLWTVSQDMKNLYVNQEERALSFFDSSIKHNKEGRIRIVKQNQEEMSIFMRRGTIRQELQDTLFQTSTQLLFDEDYVGQEMRPNLIEKIRQAITKSCTDDNAYQYQLRMQELDSLQKYNTLSNPPSKPRGYTQFSKNLIFINFHSPNEGKRWIHQDYMDSLMKTDISTPRIKLTKQAQIQLQSSTRTVPLNVINLIKSGTLQDLGHQKSSLMRQSSLSARGYNRNMTMKCKEDSTPIDQNRLSLKQQKEFDKQLAQEKAFPFKLNDCFGYWTIVITDGCYQIMVPAKPPMDQTKAKKRFSVITPSISGDNTPCMDNMAEKGLATFSGYFNELQVDDIPQSVRSSYRNERSRLSLEDSPMTFQDSKKKPDYTRDASFGKRSSVQKFKQNEPQRNFKVMNNLEDNDKSTELQSIKPNSLTGILSKTKSSGGGTQSSMNTFGTFSQNMQHAWSTKTQHQQVGDGLLSSKSVKSVSEPKSSLNTSQSLFQDFAKSPMMSRINEEESPATSKALNISVDKFISGENEKIFQRKPIKLRTKYSDQILTVQEQSKDSSEIDQFSMELSWEEECNLIDHEEKNHKSTTNSALKKGKTIKKNLLKFGSFKNIESSPVHDGNSPTTPNIASLLGMTPQNKKLRKQKNFAKQGAGSKSLPSLSFQSAFQNFQRQTNLSINKQETISQQMITKEITIIPDSLKKKKNINEEEAADAKKGIKRVGNVVIQTITNIDQLNDVRIKDKRALIKQGMRTNQGNRTPNKNVNNTSFLTARSARSQSPSPTKLEQRKQYSKNITVVRPMPLEDEIKTMKAQEPNKTDQEGASGFRNPIQFKKEDHKPKTNIAATLLSLKKRAMQNKQTEVLERQPSPSSDPKAYTGMMDALKTRINQTIASVNKQKDSDLITRNFIKYQIIKPQKSQAILKMKTPGQRILEKNKYEVGIEQKERNKVFHAIEFNQIQVVEAYIKSHMLGSDVKDVYGNTLLSISAQFGCYDICNLLIREGANLNTQNQEGNTPLHYAIAYNMSAIVDLLVESGAKETIKNKKRLTCWQGI